jgi:hypothetical protein
MSQPANDVPDLLQALLEGVEIEILLPGSQKSSKGEWASGAQKLLIRPASDRFEILQKAFHARDRAAAGIAGDEQVMRGRRALVEANIIQSPEDAAVKALEAVSRKVLPDGFIEDRFEWEGTRRFPDPPFRSGPDIEAGETEADFQQALARHRQACAHQQRLRQEAANEARQKELERLRSLPRHELAEILLSEEIRATAASAFAHAYETWTLLRCCFRAESPDTPLFSLLQQVEALPDGLREQIFSRHEQLCSGWPRPVGEGDEALPL